MCSSRCFCFNCADRCCDRPCIVPAQAGYRRLENQLYRVEIHRGTDPDDASVTPTFKWSRDNGSLVAQWLNPAGDPTRLRVDSLGPDEVRRFRSQQWVEITDETYDLHSQSGLLRQLANIEDDTLLLATADAIDGTDFPRLPKIRAWDHAATTFREADGTTTDLPLEEGAIPVREGVWIDLEDGVQVYFEPNGTYTNGDYWLIPTRVIEGDVIWPRDDSGAPQAQPPLGIEHHYCPLGLLRRESGTWRTDLVDCRRPFPPLTDLIDLQNCGEIVVRPGDDLQTIIDRIPARGNAKLCFHPGLWNLPTTVTIAGKGELVLSGAGAATQLSTDTADRVLHFTDCDLVTLRDLAVNGGLVGAIGDGLRGSLSFTDCQTVRLDQVQVTCGSYGSRRVSAVQIQTADEISVERCRIEVGHGQIGLLLVNGERITVAHNTIAARSGSFDLAEVVDDPQGRAAVGQVFMDRPVVGIDNFDPDARAVFNRNDFGLGSPLERFAAALPDFAARTRIIGQLRRWGPNPFTFYTHRQLSPADWDDLLEANPILPERGGAIAPRVVGTRLRQLRANLVRQLWQPSAAVDLEIPTAVGRILDGVVAELNRASRVMTGSQGIVVAGRRTPNFGSNELYGNGLFMVRGELAPTATIIYNQIVGFADGIHIGTSDQTSRHLRSYHVQVMGNTIQLHAVPWEAERHGIFVGHAHTVKVQDNLVQIVLPSPRDWPFPNRRDRRSRALPLPITDGIQLYGVYGPLLQIRQNHCIGVTLGISVNARHAGLHEQRVGVIPAWSITDNAYAGLGEAQDDLPVTPFDRFSSS